MKGKTSTAFQRKQPESVTKNIHSLPLITGNDDIDRDNVRNCIGCGFIYTLENYGKLSACIFCGRPLTMLSRKENRRRKEEGEDTQGLEKAEALRDRLVSYDREGSNKTPSY